MLAAARRQLSLSFDEPQLYTRPSIDVLFDSAADVYGPGLVGIVLSGANSDGAQGLQKIVAEGGLAIVQPPTLAYAAAMPTAALAMCPTARVLTPEEMATFLKAEST